MFELCAIIKLSARSIRKFNKKPLNVAQYSIYSFVYGKISFVVFAIRNGGADLSSVLISGSIMRWQTQCVYLKI